MADSSITPVAVLLLKTDPYILDDTIKNLDTISSSSGDVSVTSNFFLPLKANAGVGSSESDEDRPFLETPFNSIGGGSKYRSPWRASTNSGSDEEEVLELEQSANEVWDAYRHLFYGNDAVGSVYVRRKGSAAGEDSSGASIPMKSKKGGGNGAVLEALFGIQKICNNDDEKETARWDSVHRVTIEPPNYDDRTCEYKIDSNVWCRFKPDDVGDIPRQKGASSAKKKNTPSPQKQKKGSNTKLLDIARLERFGKAADDWSSHHSKTKSSDKNKDIKIGVPSGPPIPAVVTCSAVYKKETAKVCKLLSGDKKSNKIPIASHIQSIGSLIEKIETDFRSRMERVDTPKSVEVIQGMYRQTPASMATTNAGNSSYITKPKSYATGMGVGSSLIGEIALTAKSKGLGDNANSPSDSKNKAMESILASEMKKLQDAEAKEDSQTNDWKASLKKAPPSTEILVKNPKPSTKTSSNFRTSLEKRKPTAAPSLSDVSGNNNGVKNLQTSLKKVNIIAAPASSAATSGSAAATPEFVNFRSKLKSTKSSKY